MHLRCAPARCTSKQLRERPIASMRHERRIMHCSTSAGRPRALLLSLISREFYHGERERDSLSYITIIGTSNAFKTDNTVCILLFSFFLFLFVYHSCILKPFFSQLSFKLFINQYRVSYVLRELGTLTVITSKFSTFSRGVSVKSPTIMLI